jgi:hypothetical protein
MIQDRLRGLEERRKRSIRPGPLGWSAYEDLDTLRHALYGCTGRFSGGQYGWGVSTGVVLIPFVRKWI